MEVNTKKDKKVKKTRKKFGDGCRITEKYLKNIFSCLQLSKLSNLNIESTIHINDQTTPISNIWQLSQLFDVSMETFLKTTDFLHLHSIPLIKHQNSLYIPFIPPSQLLEFLINPKRFYQLYDVFFLSIPKEKQNLFYENHSYVCTCLNDSIHNKQSRRLEILDLSIQESIPPSTKIVIKPNNRKNIQVGTFFHEDNHFTPLALMAADRAMVVPDKYYGRRLRGGSIMTASGTDIRHAAGCLAVVIKLKTAFGQFNVSKAETAEAISSYLTFLLERGEAYFSQAREADAERLLVRELEKTCSVEEMHTLQWLVLPLLRQVNAANARARKYYEKRFSVRVKKFFRKNRCS